MPVEGTRFSRKRKLTLRLTFKRCMCMGLCWGFTVGGQFFQVTGAADFSGEWVRLDFKEEAVHHKNNPGRNSGELILCVGNPQRVLRNLPGCGIISVTAA